jgi:hypothetical protein
MTMLRLLLRLSLPLTLLFTAALSIICAQPYDNHELRAVLLPEGCPAPCFMGIRPGTMDINEAVQMLKQHKWVEQVQVSAHAVVWLWNGSQPEFLYNTPLGGSGRFGGVILLSGKTVRSVTLSSQFLPGDLYLSLGQANPINPVSVFSADYVHLTAPYQASAFTDAVLVKCSVGSAAYWRSSENIIWSVTRTQSTWSASTRFGEVLPLFSRYAC